MIVKKILLRLYYFPVLSAEKADYHQRIIRNTEWDSFKLYIPKGSRLLDVGCGAGYNLKTAQEELGCDGVGIDPDPGGHGVGRRSQAAMEGLNILKGTAEELPFADKSFGVLLCSHVLEHVTNKDAALREMSRVLKDAGVLIIGMPTAAMAWISLVTQLLFTTHMRLANVLLRPFVNTGRQKFVHIFFPPSHSDFEKTVLDDMLHYRVAEWQRIVLSHFSVEKAIFPGLYPYPEYIQLFKPVKSGKLSSSVFFICRKKRP